MKAGWILMIVTAAVFNSGCRAPQSWSAAREQTRPAVERRTVVQEAGSNSEQIEQVKRSMQQWHEERWRVLSVSAPVAQADGKLRWSAELERSAGLTFPQQGYNDSLIGSIKRGRTTEAQLVEWFGPPESREMKKDGTRRLGWKFGDGGASPPGFLEVALDAGGKVTAYTARRLPR